MGDRPRMFILTGISFSGKSSLARAVSKALDVPVIDPDGIAHESGLGLNGEFLSDAQWAVFHGEAEARAARLLEAGNSLVYDTTAFNRRQRQGLRDLAGRHNAEAVLIWASTSREEARRRWARNNETRERFIVHAEDFDMVADHFEPPGDDEPHMTYDGTQDPAHWFSSGKKLVQTALSAGLVVRDAGDADLDALARLRPPELDHRDRLRDARQPGFRYLVLEYQGEVIGFVCLVFARPATWPDSRNAALLPQIVDAFIAPPLRGRGHGSALIRALEGLAWGQGFRAVYLSVDPIGNPRAYALYQSLGYRPLQQEPYREQGQYTDSAGKVHESDDWELDMVRELHNIVSEGQRGDA